MSVESIVDIILNNFGVVLFVAGVYGLVRFLLSIKNDDDENYDE